MTRVATPETESVLLNVALHGTAHHVEQLVRKFRRVLEVEKLSRGTGATIWRGEKVDCSIAVDAMLFRRRTAAAATANA